VTKVVQTLLIANVIAFFVQNTRPDIANAFVFVPYFMLTRPWTIVTYMFLHGGMMHLFFNMMGLWFFGSGVETRLGSTRFTVMYFLSGITGALLSTMFSGSALIGASAGVFGVMFAFARFWPDTPIMVYMIIPVKARTLVIITTVLAFWSGFGGVSDGVAHFAHLGGFVGAWLYLKWWERGRTDFRKRAVAGPEEVVKRIVEKPDAWRGIDLAKVHQVNRDEVGRLVDKAAKHGISALTPEERLFLSNFVPTDVVPPPT
jgi:membrane associated rhomboid family serine protease